MARKTFAHLKVYLSEACAVVQMPRSIQPETTKDNMGKRRRDAPARRFVAMPSKAESNGMALVNRNVGCRARAAQPNRVSGTARIDLSLL